MRYPLLHIYVEIPFISIHTSLMHRSYESQSFQFIMLRWRVWKWKGEFELYRTER